MKLKYKIALVTTLAGLFILGSVSIIYSYLSYKEAINSEQNKLILSAVDSAYIVELDLKEKLYITKTIGSAPILLETLINSNAKYALLDKTKRKEKINQLNIKWKEAKTAGDPFIKPYLNNPLAKYLKYQQKVLPGIYGEIFITNRYGAMIATTGKLSTLAHYHKYWWKEAYNNGKGKVFFDDRGFDKSVEGYVVGIVIPIKKDGEIIGILKTNVNIMSTLNEVVKHYSKLNHGSLKIVRTKGLIVMEDGHPPLSTTIDKILQKKLKSMNTGYKIVNNNIVAYTPVKLTLDMSDTAFGGKPGKDEHIKGNKEEAWHAVISYSKDKALLQSIKINQIIIYIGSIFTVILIAIALFFAKLVSLPINKLSQIANRIADGEHTLRADIKTNDEVGMLSRSFNNMLTKLNKTMASRDELQLEIQKREKVERELVNLNETLEKSIQEEVEHNRIKDQQLIQQSRLAQMGEMISMIAHQWRQPLAAISATSASIELKAGLNKLDNDTAQQKAHDISNFAQHLSRTIDDFRDFFKPTKKKIETSYDELVASVLKIIGVSIKNKDIELIQELNCHDRFITYPNELKQVILNLIKNAEDALLEKEIENPYIKISTYKENDRYILEVSDNAGGVKEGIMENIFDPYFSTKTEKEGTGLGLYMSKTIIEEHCNGELSVSNDAEGAVFRVVFGEMEGKR